MQQVEDGVWAGDYESRLRWAPGNKNPKGGILSPSARFARLALMFLGQPHRRGP